jgi:hypothetical protein
VILIKILFCYYLGIDIKEPQCIPSDTNMDVFVCVILEGQKQVMTLGKQYKSCKQC